MNDDITIRSETALLEVQPHRNGNNELSGVNPPHGGILTELLADPERREQLRAESPTWPSWDLTPRQLCDLEPPAEWWLFATAGLHGSIRFRIGLFLHAAEEWPPLAHAGDTRCY